MPLSQRIKPLLEGGSTSYTPLSHWIKPLLEEGSTFYIFSNRGSGLLTPLSQPVKLPLEEERTFILDGNVIFFSLFVQSSPIESDFTIGFSTCKIVATQGCLLMRYSWRYSDLVYLCIFTMLKCHMYLERFLTVCIFERAVPNKRFVRNSEMSCKCANDTLFPLSALY